MILIVLLIIVVLVAVWGIACYNGFVKGENGIEEAFATMDVYLKKRTDLIPNLVETVKGYAAHEAGTLEAVVAARNSIRDAATTNEKIAGENQLTSALKNIFALAESYPDLKANSNFRELMEQLERIETDIAQSRKYYNAVVKNFNIRLQAFPSSIIGSMFHYTKKAMFEAEDGERGSVSVSFSEPAEDVKAAPDENIGQ